MTGVKRRVAVVGAGVIGSAAAARIAESGIDVVLFSGEPAGTTAATRASFAWVNSHGKKPEQYLRLNEDGRRAHSERSRAHRTPWFDRTGAEIDGTEYPEDGWVDTSIFLAAQLDDLRQAGGVLHEETPVRSVEHVRELAGAVDAVVVAGGADTSELIGSASAVGRLASSAGDDGFLARIRVDEHPIDRIRSLDGLQVRPDGEGGIAAQSLRIEAALRRAGAAASVRTVWPALRDEIEGALGWRIPKEAHADVAHAARPHGPDGFPVLGFVADDVYVALAHSGVTLAPLLGELIARDLHGDADPRLAPFRP